MLGKNIEVAFFDIDYTVIRNDCDVSWKKFLIEKELAPKKDMKKVLEFYQLYKNGILPEKKFIRFQLKEISRKSIRYIENLSNEHFIKYVKPTIYIDAIKEINDLRKNGIKTVAISACNIAVLKPIIEFFCFDYSIVTELEIIKQKYTGKIIGDYVIKENKWKGAEKYLIENNIDYNEAAFFADSINDIPLLKIVGFPIIINPDNLMSKVTNENKWEFIEWKKCLIEK